MKLNTITLLATFLVISNLSFAQNRTITINGNILGLDKPSKAQLFQYNDDKVDTLSTVDVLKGRLNIKLIKKAEPSFYFLKVNDLKKILTLFLDDNDVNITGSSIQWPKVVVTGSASHMDFETYHVMVDELEQKGQELSAKLKQAQQVMDSVAVDKLEKQLKGAILAYEHRQLDFIKSHSDSFYSALVIFNARWHWINKRELFDGLSARVKNSQYGLILAQSITNFKKQYGMLEVGDTIPDLTAATPKETILSVKDAIKKNKLTLIDFWASWCVPCRQENPNVVKVFNAYKQTGFGVFGVSLDEKVEDWQKAIEKDGLSWDQVSELKGWKGTIHKSYGVAFLPQNFLVDANGKILAMNVRGEQLSKKVEEFLKVSNNKS